MKVNRNMLELQIEEKQNKLRELNSYIKELSNVCAKHGTEKDQFEVDLMEAKHNVEFYEEEIARIKQELAELPESEPPQSGAPPMLPTTVKQGVGSLLFSAIGFVAGVLLGSRLQSRGRERDGQE